MKTQRKAGVTATSPFWLLAVGLCLAISSAAQNVTLISTGAVWKYLDTGTVPAATWQTAAFDDSAWAIGPGELGYGDGGEATVVRCGDTYTKYPTIYFRHRFVLSNPSALSNLTVQLLRDDGAAVYLNGVEVLRQNLPAGPLLYSTMANAAVGGLDETTYFSAAIAPSCLVAGTNVVAVEVHQNTLTSSDLSFDLGLSGQLAGSNTNPPVDPTLITGVLKREVYTNVPGMGISDLQQSAKYPAHPDLVTLVSSFEAPNFFDDNYGQRLTGFLLPPTNGNYVFYLSSDDQGALYLSSDENPTNKVLIAREDTWSPSRSWNAFSTRTNDAHISAPIPLQAGRMYYVEAVMKEGGGGDSLGVAWKLPGGTAPADGDPPIPGEFLATYGPPYPTTNLPPAITLTSPTTGTIFAPTATIPIAATACDRNGDLCAIAFLANNTCLAVFTNPPNYQGITWNWTNAAEGSYLLTAVATDTTGLTATSAPVYVTVQATTPPDPAGDREFHVVGIYQGSQPAKQAAVVVNRPGKRVTLLLSSYETVTWNVTVMTGTIVEKVILGGYHSQTVTGLPSTVPVVTYSYDTGTTDYWTGYTVDSGRFQQVVPALHALTGMEIASFHGNYQAPYPAPFTIDSVQQDPRLLSTYPEPTPLAQLTNFTFQMTFYSPGVINGSVVAKTYTLAGPVEGGNLLPSNRRVVGDGSQRFYYGISSGIMRIDTQTGTAQTMDLGTAVPELSWPMGMTFNTNYAEVLLASLGGEGFLYAYSPTLEQWSVVSSMNNLDVDSIEYHQSENALYGVSVYWGESGRGAIYRLSPDGVYLGEIELPPLPFGIGPSGYRSELVSAGNYLVLLLAPTPYYADRKESRIYLIDPRTEQIWLTYRQAAAKPNQPPTTQITSPTNGLSIFAGNSLPISASAADADGTIRALEILVNGRTYAISATSPCHFLWTNLTQGEYTLTARAADDKGAITVSAPVRITVQQPAALATRQLPATYTPGLAFTVTLALNPRASVMSYAVEDQPPPGWAITNLSEGGAFDSLNGKVKFGPFLDHQARTLTYQVIPPNTAAGSQRFTGYASADGAMELITGNQTIDQNTHPATVSLTSPGDASSFFAPASITLSAAVISGSSPVLWTEFFANDQMVGRDAEAPYVYRWDQVPAGTYVVVAKATDAARNCVVSAPITITVLSPTNAPPLVSIIQPIAGAGFTAPADITIVADAYDSDGSIARVEFYAGTNRLGLGTPVSTLFPDDNTLRLSLVWTNAPPGNYLLTAMATDNLGASAISDAVAIQVGAVHARPVVSVVAQCRLAIENTNSLIAPCYGYFAIIREGGDLRLPLTVWYSLGGSASNGVDYVALPETVEIPAGETTALLKIDPLADSLVEGHETVDLSLTAQSNYDCGASNQARVYIIDPIPVPPLPPGMGSLASLAMFDASTLLQCARVFQGTAFDGTRQLLIVGQAGQTVTIEVSENLTEWKSLGSFKLARDGVLEFVDPTAARYSQSFYRVVGNRPVSP